MAQLTPTKGTATASGATVLRAAAAATASYVPTTNTCLTTGWRSCVFGIDYAKSAESAIAIKFEGYDGTTWRPLGYADVPSSGLRELTKTAVNLTPANYDASDSVLTPPMSCVGVQEVRAQIKGTSAGAFGTIAISVSFGEPVF